MGKKEIRREYISYKCAATPYTSHDLEIAREKNTDRKLIKRHNVRTHQGQTQSCTRTSLRNPLKSPGGCSPPAEGAGPRRDGMAPPLAQPPPPGKEEQRAKGQERVPR